MNIILTHGEGLQELCIDELRRQLISFRLLAKLQGKFLVAVESTSDLDVIRRLRIVERVFLAIHHELHVRHSKVLNAVEKFCSSDKFSTIEECVSIVAGSSEERGRSFRINVKCSNNFARFRQPISSQLKRYFQDRHQWKVDLSSPLIVVQVFLQGNALLIGIPLVQQSLAVRSELTPLTYGLRTSVAAAMVQLVTVSASKGLIRFCDPFCGRGIVLFELVSLLRAEQASLSSTMLQLVAIDCDATALESATANLDITSGGDNLSIDYLLADFLSNPFKPSTFDVIISDLPFGRQHAIPGQPADFYSRLARTLRLCCTTTAQVVLLASLQHGQLLRSSMLQNGFTPVRFYPLSCGSTRAVLQKFQRD